MCSWEKITHITKYFSGRTLNYLFAVIIPLVLLPLPLKYEGKEAKCGYVILLMIFYWILEPIPIAATSLFPIVLFPLLDIIDTAEACLSYMNPAIMMLFGSLIIAIAIEKCNVHKRVAFNVLLRFGGNASWMMLGLMITAMFISMWISNTATAALMVPIADAIITELENAHSVTGGISPQNLQNEESNLPTDITNDVISSESNAQRGNEDEHRNDAGSPDTWEKGIVIFKKAMLLSIAYASSLGGTGTLTGTGPNLVVKGVIEKWFPESRELSFDRWMLFNVPVMIMCVLLAWGFLTLVYVKQVFPKQSKDASSNLLEIIQQKYDELGTMMFQEKVVIFLFTVLVFLWIFRDPYLIDGWSKYFSLKINDATPAIGIPILLFMIPSEPWKLNLSLAIIDWKVVQAKMPWGAIFLLGGGFSLAEGSKKSGLSFWVSEQLASLNIPSPITMVIILCLFTVALTQVTSNIATANIFLPVVISLALTMKVNPILFMLPVTICSSFAFVLPVGTPPNAIVFMQGQMETMDMVKPGIFMSIACLLIEVFMIKTLGSLMFDFDTFPQWANISHGTDSPSF